MANEFVQTIAEARVDAQSLSDFVFKPSGFKVARRLAPTIDTLQFYIDRFNSLNGDFSSSVSVALSSLNSSVAEADGKVAYIETTVQDAINNTAVEGGVLADTFVTMTANGVGAVARTQRELNAEVVYAENFGAIGDGIVDDGAALRKAVAHLATKGGGVLICGINKVYRCSLFDFGGARPSILFIPNNVFIDLRGSEIKTGADATNFNYNIIDYTDTDTCGIVDGTLRGNFGYTDSTAFGEWGMGLGFYGTKNFYGRNLKLIECGGDGIYVGRVGSLSTKSSNIMIDNVYIDGCMRQGISLISVDGFYSNNLRINNIRGKNPQSGIDFEPNNNFEQLTNIVMNNTVIDNSLIGILSYLPNLDTTSAPVDITMNNTSINGCNRGLYIRRANKIKGAIRFTGRTQINGSVNAPFEIPQNEGLELVFDDLTIDDRGLTPTSNNLMALGAGNDVSTVGLEKLKIKSLSIIGELYTRVIYIRGTNQPFIRDLDITIDRVDASTISPNTPIYTASGQEGEKPINIKASKDVVSFIDQRNSFSVTSDIPNRSMSGGFITITGLPVGNVWTIYSESETSEVTLRVSENTKFLPSGSLGQYLRLGTKGSWVKLKRVSATEIQVLSGVGYRLEEPSLPISVGTTEQRPVGVAVGYTYFDTTLSKPIYYKSVGEWVDATGATV